ncbi:MAG: DegT/DnrJ/EryC1/StrS family aminotransferase [Sedimentisphaerales bacterium]
MTASQFIPLAKPDFCGNEQKYVAEALASTWVSGGPFVERLEHDFANYFGARFALTTANGTSALHMAFLALGVGPGDEIVIPGFAFLAAANISLLMNAIPVFAEVSPDTWCVTAAAIEKCLSPRTKLIVPVHTYGNVCDMDPILTLAESRNIPIVEDVAEALASRYKGRYAGTLGTIGTFSFQATKTITTGEGGMVVTEDKDIYAQMALYRSHGMLRKRYYWHELAGHNFRLTNMQAAIGCAQMEMLNQKIAGRKRVHQQYKRHLSDNDGLVPQFFQPEVEAVPWAIAVKLNPRAYPQGRDTVMQQMRDAQIETRPGFCAPGFMNHLYTSAELPVCKDVSQQVIVLPAYSSLSDNQIEFICATLMSLRS